MKSEWEKDGKRIEINVIKMQLRCFFLNENRMKVVPKAFLLHL